MNESRDVLSQSSSPQQSVSQGGVPQSVPGPVESASRGEKPPFNLGGQAIIEGVMMRSPRFVGAAVRLPDGTIETRVERFDSVLMKSPWLRLPLVRGVVALVEMMFVGVRYLKWSGDLSLHKGATVTTDTLLTVAPDVSETDEAVKPQRGDEA